MVWALNELEMIREGCAAYTLFVYENCCHSVHDPLFHLVLYAKALNRIGLEVSFVITSWKNMQVHLILNALAVKSTTRPISYDLMIVAGIENVRRAGQATLTLLILDAIFFIKEDGATELC